MSAEERAIGRYEKIVFQHAPSEEIRPLTVEDLKRSFLGCRLLIGEYSRDIWTELRKPLDRFLTWVARPRITS